MFQSRIVQHDYVPTFMNKLSRREFYIGIYGANLPWAPGEVRSRVGVKEGKISVYSPHLNPGIDGKNMRIFSDNRLWVQTRDRKT